MAEEEMSQEFEHVFHRDQNQFGDPDVNQQLQNVQTVEDNNDSSQGIVGELIFHNNDAGQDRQPKQSDLETVLAEAFELLKEDRNIQSKSNGLKIIVNKVQQSKIRPHLVVPLCNWLNNTEIIERFLHNDSHTLVLRNLSLILKFLYDQSHIKKDWIHNFIMRALNSHEELLKVGQNFLNYLNVEDLSSVFHVLAQPENIEQQNFHLLISSIVNCKVLSASSCNMGKAKAKKAKEADLVELLQEKEDEENLQSFSQTENESEEMKGRIQNKLAVEIFEFLMEIMEKNPQTIGNIANKLISNKINVLQDNLLHALALQLKKNQSHSLILIENCLKMDFGAKTKDKENGEGSNQKFNFFTQLSNEGLYEHITIILARNRFVKNIVDKVTSVIMLLSKHLKKPLDAAYTVCFWKILGLNSRDEKEREQFFCFVKDCLRHEFSFTEESVQYIFFEILMKLHAEWFSIKILDCLELLFMRLNEDLKLLSYQTQDSKYSIEDCELIGLDKFWYIYFNVADPKVVKRCKECLFKFSTFDCSNSHKRQFMKTYIDKIVKTIDLCDSSLKESYTERGFEMIEKMSDQTTKKVVQEDIQLNIKNETQDADHPKHFSVLIEDKKSILQLKDQICTTLNPPRQSKNIRLLTSGKFLKGENRSLKDLGFVQGQTIMVTDIIAEDSDHIKKEKIKENIQNLIEIFGMEHDHSLIAFIAEKMAGENIDEITSVFIDEDKMATYHSLFQSRQVEVGESQGKEIKEEKGSMVLQEMEEIRFNYLIAEDPQIISKVINFAEEWSYRRGWRIIRNLPYCGQMLREVEELAGKEEWDQVFNDVETEMSWIYNAHLLKQIVGDEQKMKRYLVEKGGYRSLLKILKSKLEQKSSTILLELVSSIVLVPLQKNSQFLTQFLKRIKSSWASNSLNTLMEESYMEEEAFLQQDLLDPELMEKVMRALQDGSRNFVDSEFPSLNLIQILLYCMKFHEEWSVPKMLDLTSQQLHDLLKYNGYSGEYLIIFALARSFVNKIQVPKSMPQILKDLLDYCLTVLPAAEFPPNLIAQYDLATQIITHESISMAQLEINLIQDISESIKKMSTQMAADQLQGNLHLLKVCLKNLYAEGNILSEQMRELGKSFGYWLFSTILFNFESQHPQIRHPQIRTNCYEIFSIVSEKEEDFADNLSQQIINLNIEKRKKNEASIGFRTSPSESIGISNMGATCYINSLLQQLYHTKFSKLLLEIDEDPINLKELKTSFMGLHSSVKDVINLDEFVHNTQFYGEAINPKLQQDAYEFLTHLFGLIQMEANPKYKECLNEVFGGVLLNEIRYYDPNGNECVSEQEEHFYGILVDLKNKKNLIEALNYYVKPVELNGDNMYSATIDGKEYKTKALKRSLLVKMPNILMITLKRFDYESNNVKLYDYFEFYHDLDLQKYTEPYLRNKPDECPETKYKLVGIIVHIGTTESGHYYSYIKVGEKWVEFNDRKVQDFNIAANLKSECFGDSEGKKTKSAYVLFYEKVNTNYHGVHLDEILPSNPIAQIVREDNMAFLKSRLASDEHFKKLVEHLQVVSKKEGLKDVIEILRGKGKQGNEVNDINEWDEWKEGQGKNNLNDAMIEGTVHYNSEEKRNLLDELDADAQEAQLNDQFQI